MALSLLEECVTAGNITRGGDRRPCPRHHLLEEKPLTTTQQGEERREECFRETSSQPPEGRGEGAEDETKGSTGGGFGHRVSTHQVEEV